MDQVFAIRHVCEKYLANRKDVFLGICGFGKDLLRVMQLGRNFESSAEFLCR